MFKIKFRVQSLGFNYLENICMTILRMTKKDTFPKHIPGAHLFLNIKGPFGLYFSLIKNIPYHLSTHSSVQKYK